MCDVLVVMRYGMCDVLVQLCGCSLVVLGLYLHADRQSSIYIDLLQSIPVSGPLVITGHLATRGTTTTTTMTTTTTTATTTCIYHRSPSHGARTTTTRRTRRATQQQQLLLQLLLLQVSKVLE